MSRVKTTYFVKIFFACIAALCIAAFVCCLTALSCGVAYAADDRSETETTLENYRFDKSILTGVSSGTAAAVYFSAKLNDGLYFKCVFEDGREVTQESPYFLGLDGEVRVFVVRDEDEQYSAFETEIELVKIDGKIIILPDGQRVFYSGLAQSAVYEDGEEAALSFFDEDGAAVAEAKDSGNYYVSINYATESGESLDVRAAFEIEPLPVTVRAANLSRRYKESFASDFENQIVVDKSLTEADALYIKEHTETAFESGVGFDTPVGDYTIAVSYTGDDKNLAITVENGVLKILPGIMKGFRLTKVDVKFDGKTHYPQLVYDEEEWSDFSTEYNLGPVSAIGEYKYTVIVRKENYEELVLNAEVIIRCDYLESSSLTDYVRLDGHSDGYYPEMKISMVETQLEGLEEALEKVLVQTDRTKEEVVKIFDIRLEYRDIYWYLTNDPCHFTVKLSGLDSAEGVRILQFDGEGFEEPEYTFDNGYFSIRTNDAKGFVFVKTVPIKHSRVATLVPTVLVGGIVVLVIIAVLLATFVTGGRERRRSRRRHSRWA